ncbi:MAG: hypothetical protein Fur0044_44460 [Anaerolineae bacterium]|nr:hypothetical protein [Anaerolineae bacterium]
MSPIRLIGLTALLRNRLPLIGGWLRRYAVSILAEEESPLNARLLAETVVLNPNSRTGNAAAAVLSRLTHPAAIDAVCEMWAGMRHPALAVLIANQGWVATKPPDLKVLTALQAGHLAELAEGRAEMVRPLVQAAADTDPKMAAQAKQILRQLRYPAAQEALCRLVIEQDLPPAREAALEAGYLPQEPAQRALFFFLTDQWARYDSLDFDRRLLRTVYQSAAPALRQRLLERMRQAGRTEFLPIITGSDYRTRLAEMEAGEFDLLAHTLTLNREWPELWALTFEAPFRWSRQIIKTLAGEQWRPAQSAEQMLFDHLAALVQTDSQENGVDVARLFPPALLQAQARAPGRINDVAFAPGRPVLALGTGQGKVVLWNFQQAVREHVLTGFDHSVGSVAFNPHNVLFCAERTTSGSTCALYRWDDEHGLQRLGQHNDSITALAALSDSHALSAGRDQRVSLWDAAARREVKQRNFSFWARALRVSPSGQEVVLLHEGVDLLALPELRVTERGPGGTSVARCAAFSPDEQTLLVGQFNGEVIILQRQSPGPFKRPRESWPGRYGRLVGLEMLPMQEVIICADAGGRLEFKRLNDYDDLGQVQSPGGQLTSLHVSADEAFMVVGSAQAALSLWDLRPLAAPRLLARPFGQASPAQISILHTLSRLPQLSPPARRALEFAECILQHRFRHAIELDDAPQIKIGEFDIELE